jgi:hypothetical protein
MGWKMLPDDYLAWQFQRMHVGAIMHGRGSRVQVWPCRACRCRTSASAPFAPGWYNG